MAKLKKCIFCGCIMAECITEEEAIEAFNNRVTEEEIRNKAIDEFAERLLKKSETIPVKIGNRYIQAVEKTFLEKRIKAIAEQLKGE